ncbi:sulfite exporter TauE/SafE family protein [Kushneria indalinina]|uniref:Probable membrane transporter protein n=1 Tax=Kushneria indalinina DSM 14324 TaxID=1122140 RepID=A0A3D9DVI2_9GAMM|nr:sulfite exporter TauE/SafE family protein [Kushneria indalinina]REC94756.1 hypothetical protein C8D72_1584 [Kushneria indalinina DSM 14324]
MIATPSILTAAVGLALLAGGVRGYCGFGFAMLLSLGLMLFLPPVVAVPVALLLDLVTSIGLWRRALRHAHWHYLRYLLPGMLLMTGPGVLLLSWVPVAPMRVLVALLALAGALALMLQRQALDVRGRASPRAWMTLGAGMVSGLCMTLASSGGPPLMLYLLYCRLSADRLRATAIVFFAVSSTLSLLGLWGAGSLSYPVLGWGAWLILPALAGNLLGQWLFERAPPASLKNSVAPLLGGLALLVLLHELLF